MWLNRVLASAAIVCIAYLAQAQTAPDERKIWNDVYTRLTAQSEPFRPNPFLTRILDGKTPGNAMDIGMGQGRNALMLAERGWQVTGFDISDVAIDQAQAEAKKRGVKLNAVVAHADTFDYGTDRYDLVAAIFVHGAVTSRASDVLRSLKRGGLLVVEGFHRDAGPYGYETNELLQVFGSSLTVLHYEDAIGQPDGTWRVPGKDLRFVRLVARKE